VVCVCGLCVLCVFGLWCVCVLCVWCVFVFVVWCVSVGVCVCVCDLETATIRRPRPELYCSVTATKEKKEVNTTDNILWREGQKYFSQVFRLFRSLVQNSVRNSRQGHKPEQYNLFVCSVI